MKDYSKRLFEVDEVLEHLEPSSLEKIPKEFRKMIKENKDKNYIWKYDETKELWNQGLCKDTIAILSYINMEYLINSEQKALLEKMHEFNENKI